jgi:endonuclease YncB( thermonuclease family)
MQNLKYQDVPLFTFQGLACPAKIVKIIDGDTIHAIIEYNEKMIRLVCRLHGIDTPEMKQTPIPAKKARNRLFELCSNCTINVSSDMMDTKILNGLLDNNTKLVQLEFMGKEKYGRELVKIYLESGVCVNDIMIEENHAYAYNGGKKH